jgi:hypothetical protein
VVKAHYHVMKSLLRTCSTRRKLREKMPFYTRLYGGSAVLAHYLFGKKRLNV